jgi:hypothetical protein
VFKIVGLNAFIDFPHRIGSTHLISTDDDGRGSGLLFHQVFGTVTVVLIPPNAKNAAVSQYHRPALISSGHFAALLSLSTRFGSESGFPSLSKVVQTL